MALAIPAPRDATRDSRPLEPFAAEAAALGEYPAFPAASPTTEPLPAKAPPGQFMTITGMGVPAMAPAAPARPPFPPLM